MTNNPPIAAWAPSTALHKLASRHNNAPCILTDGPAEFNDVALIRLSDYEKLARYYKNGIDCFANPCERHSGERTPPFSEFFERYGGQCLICVVDNNKTLQAKIEELKRALAESRANDLTAMGYLNQIRQLVGGDDFSDMVRRCEKLQAENALLRAAIRRLCNLYEVDDYYMGQLREERLEAAVNQAIEQVKETTQ